eukprot:CAMPEP_0172450490 /NCGR_PEP_ID=MMETSP1065-20121228/8803_1 /TAXON_ID=265537 /ORGANISM="Amphiprora paludosa, Strain CCMP125" /LENGTH=142 /DNA_ID=CAMNT_0013202277 /DNA_START=42 /DNA_END=470 /DNA_ORIENTATION=+
MALLGTTSDQTNPPTLELEWKLMVGLDYCTNILENPVLAQELQQVQQAYRRGLNKKAENGSANTVGQKENSDNTFSHVVAQVGRALSYNPSRMTPELVQLIRDTPEMTPPRVVELVSFLATLQTLHRIISFNELQKQMKTVM